MSSLFYYIIFVGLFFTAMLTKKQSHYPAVFVKFLSASS